MIRNKNGYTMRALLTYCARHWDRGQLPSQDGNGIFYLGEGYWRLKAVDEEGHIVKDPLETPGSVYGILLINPDRTQEELRVVEHGIAIIERLTYTSGG